MVSGPVGDLAEVPAGVAGGQDPACDHWQREESEPADAREVVEGQRDSEAHTYGHGFRETLHEHVDEGLGLVLLLLARGDVERLFRRLVDRVAEAIVDGVQ